MERAYDINEHLEHNLKITGDVGYYVLRNAVEQLTVCINKNGQYISNTNKFFS